MRAMVQEARRVGEEWLAVQVPREANGDADRLSHPSQLWDVWLDAEDAGLTVHRARVDEEAWTALRRAIRLGGWGRRGRQG